MVEMIVVVLLSGFQFFQMGTDVNHACVLDSKLFLHLKTDEYVSFQIFPS